MTRISIFPRMTKENPWFFSTASRDGCRRPPNRIAALPSLFTHFMWVLLLYAEGENNILFIVIPMWEFYDFSLFFKSLSENYKVCWRWWLCNCGRWYRAKDRHTAYHQPTYPRIPLRRLFVISFGHSYRLWVCIIIY